MIKKTVLITLQGSLIPHLIFCPEESLSPRLRFFFSPFYHFKSLEFLI